MSVQASAPGWVARCPECPYEVDLESLGWTRINAYSWGKRHTIHCPQCDQNRWMHIVHVDEHGNPDQPLGLVLRKVLAMQLRIWLFVVALLIVLAAIKYAISLALA